MSRLDELIEKLCPNGVEYIELNKLCKFQNGFSFKSSLFKQEGEEILRITNISDGKLNDNEYVFFDKNDYKENLSQYQVKKGNIVVAMSGATTGKIGYNDSDKVYYLNQRVGMFLPNEDKLNNKYLYYWLLGKSKNILNISSGTGAQPNLSSVKMMKFYIPVPPLEVQCEIVHILDDFTELLAELSEELKKRQKQYEYYENLLFDFDRDKREYKQVYFQDIATFSQGIQVDVNKQYYEKFENSVPFLRIVDFVNKNEPSRYIEKPNEKYIKKENEMIMIRYGASAAGRVFTNKYGAIANNMFKINLKNNTEINLEYLKYYLSQNSIYTILNKSGNSTMPAINFKFLGKLVINIPKMKEQERIVRILDKFNKLCNDISEGLPAEIEARQKQYEYYRDKLLTFKELKINE